jgi:ribosomal protein S18 acetylase RimI-like enzyme
MIKIRKAQIVDFETIQAVARDTIDKCYRSFLGNEGVDHFINSGESDNEVKTRLSNCTVLEVDDQIMGYCVAFADFIHILMISPILQRRGLGSYLLLHMEQELVANGQNKLRLETFKSNGQAISFYQKNGWFIEREEQDESFGFTRAYLVKSA